MKGINKSLSASLSRLRSLVFLPAFLLSLLAKSQSSTFIQYTAKDGLPSMETYQAFQDREGFIWFGTDNGIVKYDGESMQVMTSRDGLSDPVVFGFQEDSSGKLWLQTYSGMLSYIENGRVIEYPYNDKILSVIENSIISFSYSPESRELHFMVRAAKCKIDSLGNLSIVRLKQNGFHYNELHGIWQLNWFDDNYTITIDSKEFNTNLTNNPYNFGEYYGEARLLKRQNSVLFSIKNHLFEFDGTTVKLKHRGKAPIISISEDRNDNIWIGYLNAGFELFHKDTLVSTLALSELKQYSVTSVLQDQSGGYWITTLESGVFFYPNTDITNHYFDNNTKISQVRSLGDMVVVGTQQGQLFLIDPKSNQKLAMRNFSAPIHSIITDKFNSIWLYSERNLSILDKNLRTVKSHDTHASNFSLDADGIWVQGGKRLRKFNWSGELLADKFLPNKYRSMLYHDSLFVLAGRVGLEIRNINLELEQLPKDFLHIKVLAINSLTDSLLLVSTLGNGLVVVDKNFKSLNHFDSENQFIADNINSTIIQDSIIWLGTEKGLIMIEKSSIVSGKPIYKLWNRFNGLLNNIVLFVSVNRHSILAFYENGYTNIPLNLLNKNEVKPKGYLKYLEVNDKRVDPNAYFKLPYDHSKIVVHVGFLSLDNRVLRIRYRLNSANAWVYTNDRILQFSSLAPGNYQLQIEYSTDNINWHATDIAIKFMVGSPWWIRWYSLSLGVVILVLLLLLYFKRRIQIQNQKNKLLQLINTQQQELVQAEVQITERERKRLAKELHDSISTQLTAIKLNVVNILNKREKPGDLEKIDQHLKNTINEVRSMAYQLAPPEIERYGLFTALNNHFDRVAEASGIKIDFSVFGEDIQATELSITVFRILQELSNNTLKHTNAENIKVNINSFENSLNILYEDDGGGFFPEKAKNGLGLPNIRSRVQAIGGITNFESTSFGVSYVFEFPKK